MVRITEEEFTGLDGRVRKVRKMKPLEPELNTQTGTVEEYSGTTAEE